MSCCASAAGNYSPKRDHAHCRRRANETPCAAGKIPEGFPGSHERQSATAISERRTANDQQLRTENRELRTALQALHINGNDLTLEGAREVAVERRPAL